ncbi:nitroreductase family deazaflavin-dependent oxidoreductase [Nocardioides currus]|uniref:Nitroreductase family deazaflavin-dependent oxidoreductase n=1 Tax=Nocardioides currus TaxID=2133958 RepID=A0A2R7YV93_9ACTN|nr:nitroreductase family deazaflavin-dependent oxidoreductase [Nocardioides currus]PUA80288.1 nitroreductase family deazaflavin-dependent oxidoreductase [Nocardioides currus]
MGLAADLGYRHRPGNALQRRVAAFASSRPGAWLFARTLRHIDSVVLRLSRGRHSAPNLLAGLPVLDLTTTGRKSGQPRTSHLISVPIDDDLALLGTNFGQPSTPAWVFNLEADPRASVSYRGRSVKVLARSATADERARVIARSAGIYGGYQKYLKRISGREVRIFVLESVGRSD